MAELNPHIQTMLDRGFGHIVDIVLSERHPS